MAPPIFKLAIVWADGHTPAIFPGGGPLERDLITACTEAIVKRGVGLFKTEAAVKRAILEGMTEVIVDLKNDTRYVI